MRKGGIKVFLSNTALCNLVGKAPIVWLTQARSPIHSLCGSLRLAPQYILCVAHSGSLPNTFLCGSLSSLPNTFFVWLTQLAPQYILCVAHSGSLPNTFFVWLTQLAPQYILCVAHSGSLPNTFFVGGGGGGGGRGG